MNKFKVGDRVRAISITPYIITTKGWLGKVTQIYEEGAIEVKGEDNDSYRVNAEYFELVSGKGRPVKEEKIMFIATYDVNDVDPHKTFTSRKELTDWLKEAKDDTSIKFSSIKVYEIKKEFKVIINFRLV